MTEDEAKTKWCPFTRIGEQASGAAENRPDGSYSCIASACMAWRWTTEPVPSKTEEAETGTKTPRVKIAPPEGKGWLGHAAGRDRPDRPGEPRYRWVTWRREIAAAPGIGFCGLAGAPQ